MYKDYDLLTNKENIVIENIIDCMLHYPEAFLLGIFVAEFAVRIYKQQKAKIK